MSESEKDQDAEEMMFTLQLLKTAIWAIVVIIVAVIAAHTAIKITKTPSECPPLTNSRFYDIMHPDR